MKFFIVEEDHLLTGVRKGSAMELETFWDEELPSDNDDRVSKIEAEIAETKALLSRLSQDDDLF